MINSILVQTNNTGHTKVFWKLCKKQCKGSAKRNWCQVSGFGEQELKWEMRPRRTHTWPLANISAPPGASFYWYNERKFLGRLLNSEYPFPLSLKIRPWTVWNRCYQKHHLWPYLLLCRTSKVEHKTMWKFGLCKLWFVLTSDRCVFDVKIILLLILNCGCIQDITATSW